MHIKRTLGYAQIILATIIFFASIVVSQKTIDLNTEQTLVLQNVMQNHVTSDTGKTLIFSNMYNGAMTRAFVVLATAVVLISLAIFMFIEGISKTRLGTQDDIAESQLGFFLAVVVAIVGVISLSAALIMTKVTLLNFVLWVVIAFVNWYIVIKIHEKTRATKKLNKHVGFWITLMTIWVAYLFFFIAFIS
ncbi:hypothetical protein JW868_03280 [Candidatus Woesearchaeota archaeon]|nr:hypothetical protein [Candidatus Woesearchaeota archaeon]